MRAKGVAMIAIIMAMFFAVNCVQVYGFEKMRLKEIINQGGVRQAIVINSSGEEFMIEEGDTLPDYGIVEEIRERTLIIKKSYSDGRILYIYYELNLPNKPGTVKIK